MNKERYLKKSTDYIELLVNRVHMLNSLNYYDINISSESFFSGLLNLVYDWNLKNLNNEISNAVSIDLYDDINHVAVQVTSDSTASKIHNTINKFIENELYQKYGRLVVMVIDHKERYAAKFETNDKFNFNKDSDIITIKKLLKDISNLDTLKVKKISEYLEFEIGTVLDQENVWNMQQAFETIETATNNVMTRDFFKIDDKDFIELFNHTINANENVFIKGYSKEESLYCVLNQLINIEIKKPVYVIRNEETWNKAKDYLQDVIVIPFFYADEIKVIKNNINIIICNNDSSTVNKKFIEMRRRKTGTLIDNLNCDVVEAQKLISETNGLFPFIKRQLFDGDMKNPAWAENVSRCILTALLVGKWTEREGDKTTIEDLSGIDFNSFVLEISKLSTSENPFVIKISGRGENRYQLTDATLSWSILGEFVSDDFIEEFLEKGTNIILSKDPLFDLPRAEHFYGSIRAEKSPYSNEIRHGILRSMTFIALNKNQSLIDYNIKKILSKVDTLNMWEYIAQFAEELCEASPSEFISKVENSLNDEAFVGLFDSADDTSITARHYYTHILWALEKLFAHKGYLFRAVNVLMELNQQKLKYKMGNSPKRTLESFFCTWLNITVALPDEKIRIAEQGIKKYDSMWEILFDMISDKHSVMPGSAPTFNYRDSGNIYEVTYKDMYTQKIEYLKLIRQYVNSDCARWCRLIEIFKIVSDDILDQMLDEISDSILSMKDADKEKIKSKLRRLVNDHRYFKEAEWAKDEEWIIKIENASKSIKFENPLYDFLYITVQDHDICMYTPPTMEEGQEKHKEARGRLLEREFGLFKSLNLNICDLIRLSQNYYFNLGYNIARYYSCDTLDDELFQQIINISDAKNVAAGYVGRLYEKDSSLDIIKQALKICKENNVSDELYVRILEVPAINEQIFKLILEQNAEIQKKYFNEKWISLSGEEPFCRDLLSICIEHKAANCLLRILYYIKETLSVDEVISYLYKFTEIINPECDRYMLVEIVEHIHQNIKGKYSKYESMYQLELCIHKILGWENMICVQHLFKTDATIYAELISIVLKSDNNDEPNEKQIRLAESYFDLYYDAKFCPGEIENGIDDSILNKWINTFEDCLNRQNQSKHYYYLLGKLFAYSPIGTDGYYPHESIREIIEKNYGKNMQSGYVSSEINKRGVHTSDAGESEKQLALRYKENADSIRISSPKTAEIFDVLSNHYLAESKAERERAENGEW